MRSQAVVIPGSRGLPKPPRAAGRAITVIIAVAIILVWAATEPIFHIRLNGGLK